MSEKNTNKIALLIDADNASYKLIGEIISEAGKFGKVTIRRAYGDFTDEHLKGWKDVINTYAIRPMQKFAYTSGKNSTDSAMIIDAMDILHDEAVTGFCIVSSDSDYTGLATRIREEGVSVIGIGQSKTPEAFQKACEIFVFTENLVPQKIVQEKSNNDAKPKKLQAVKITDLAKVVSKIDKKPIDIEMLDKAVRMAIDSNGLAYMSTIKEKIKTLDPSFDTRTYGFGSMTTLFKSLADKYEFVYKNDGSSLYVKPKFN